MGGRLDIDRGADTSDASNVAFHKERAVAKATTNPNSHPLCVPIKLMKKKREEQERDEDDDDVLVGFIWSLGENVWTFGSESEPGWRRFSAVPLTALFVHLSRLLSI